MTEEQKRIIEMIAEELDNFDIDEEEESKC